MGVMTFGKGTGGGFHFRCENSRQTGSISRCSSFGAAEQGAVGLLELCLAGRAAAAADAAVLSGPQSSRQPARGKVLMLKTTADDVQATDAAATCCDARQQQRQHWFASILVEYIKQSLISALQRELPRPSTPWAASLYAF
jgi:hypothetical protein